MDSEQGNTDWRRPNGPSASHGGAPVFKARGGFDLGESIQREVTRSVKERRNEQLHITGQEIVQGPKIAQIRKFFHQEVLELSLGAV